MESTSESFSQADLLQAAFTPLQKSLHIVPGDYTDDEASNITVSRFYRNPIRYTVYSVSKSIQLEATSMPTDITTEEEKLIVHSYTIPRRCHRLMHLVVTMKVPSVAVREEYREFVQIAYCKNLSHNVVRSAVLDIPGGENLKCAVDTHYHDCLREKDIVDVTSYDMMIGNRSSLIEWNTNLETNEPISCPLRFFIDDDPSFAIPAHLFHEQYAVKLKIKYTLNLTSLLKMRVRENDKAPWVEISLQKQLLEEDDNDYGVFVTPKVWAYYRSLTEAELLSEKDGVMMVIQQAIPMTRIKNVKSCEIDIKNGNSAVRGIKYVFLNESRAARNDRSHYALEDDADPQSLYGISCGDSAVFELRDSIHSTLIDSYYGCKRGSNVVHDITFDFSPYSTDLETSMVFEDNTKLRIVLRCGDYPTESENTTPILRIPWKDDPTTVITAILKNHYIKTQKRDLRGSKNPRLMFIGYLRIITRLEFHSARVVVHT